MGVTAEIGEMRIDERLAFLVLGETFLIDADFIKGEFAEHVLLLGIFVDEVSLVGLVVFLLDPELRKFVGEGSRLFSSHLKILYCINRTALNHPDQ